jgi:hypothetical protein
MASGHEQPGHPGGRGPLLRPDRISAERGAGTAPLSASLDLARCAGLRLRLADRNMAGGAPARARLAGALGCYFLGALAAACVGVPGRVVLRRPGADVQRDPDAGAHEPRARTSTSSAPCATAGRALSSGFVLRVGDGSRPALLPAYAGGSASQFDRLRAITPW